MERSRAATVFMPAAIKDDDAPVLPVFCLWQLSICSDSQFSYNHDVHADASAAAGYGYNKTSSSCAICRKGFFGTGLTNSTGTVAVAGQPTQVPCQACPADTTTARPQTASARACVTPPSTQSVTASRVAATGAAGIDFSRVDFGLG
jgi:hypothetical protein